MAGFGSRFFASRLTADVALLLALFMVPSLSAQTPSGQDAEFLDHARRLNSVAAQKMEADVRTGLREAERLAVSDPSRALERLQKLAAHLEADTALTEQRREQLQRIVKERLRVTTVLAQDTARASGERAAKEAKRSAAPWADEATNAASSAQLRQAIQQWQKDNNHPAAQAAERTKTTANRVAENRELQTERELRTQESLRSVDRSSLPPRGDFELPKDWKQRVQNRKGSNDTVLSAKERAILQTLDSTLSPSFRNSRFLDVIEYLETITGLPIVVDRNALEAAGVTYDTPITLQARGVTLRTVLRKILGELGLTYVIRDETVQVVTPQQARALLVARPVYIGDLLFGGLLERQLQAAQLIELITSTIDPSSWEIHGGSGKIVYDDVRRSLVIKQSAELFPVLSGALR